MNKPYTIASLESIATLDISKNILTTHFFIKKDTSIEMIEAWSDGHFIGNLLIANRKVVPASHHYWRLKLKVLFPIDSSTNISLKAFNKSELIFEKDLQVEEIDSSSKSYFSLGGPLRAFKNKIKKNLIIINDKNNFLLVPLKKYSLKKQINKIVERENCVFFCTNNLNPPSPSAKVQCLENLTQAFADIGWTMYIIHRSKRPFISEKLNIIELKNVKLPFLFKFSPEVFSRTLSNDFLKAVDLNHKRSKQNISQKSYEENFLKVRSEFNRILYLTIHHKPQIFISWHQWNSFTHLNKTLSDFLQIKHFYVHEGPVYNTLAYDDIGEMGVSTICKNPDVFISQKITKEDINQTMELLSSHTYNQRDRKSQVQMGSARRIVENIRSQFSKVIFYCGVNDYNTGMLPTYWEDSHVHSPYFLNTIDALEYLVDLAEKNNWLIMYKPHPNIALSDMITPSNNLLVLHNANTSECIECADITTTILSSVVYNSMNRKKPSVIFGKMQLGSTDSIYQAKSIYEVEQTIKDALNHKDFELKLNNYHEHMARIVKYSLLPYSDNDSSLFQPQKRHCINLIKKATFFRSNIDWNIFFQR